MTYKSLIDWNWDNKFSSLIYYHKLMKSQISISPSQDRYRSKFLGKASASAADLGRSDSAGAIGVSGAHLLGLFWGLLCETIGDIYIYR